MRIEQKLFFMFFIVGLMLAYPFPTRAAHNKVRIHVPTNIRTVYKTKIVKVPQHHHYFHEKIKEVPKYIPIPNHYDHHNHYDDHDHYDHDHYDHYDRHRNPYEGY